MTINKFLINKGIKSNTETITILQMIKWVDEWQEQEQLALTCVSSRFYQIDFGNHLRCKVKAVNNKIEVEGAINGWGDGVPLSEVVVVEVQRPITTR